MLMQAVAGGSVSGLPEIRIRRLAVVLNEGGGTIRKLGVDEVVGTIVDAAVAAKLVVDVRRASGDAIPGAIRAAIDAVRGGHADGLVVGGGDGTVSGAAAACIDTDVPLGVLPLGTLNHFAKDLGMPLDLAEAIAALARSEPRQVDVGEVGGRFFVNNSVIGIYPYMVEDRERRRRGWGMGKWPAMALSFGRMLRRFPRRRIKLRTAAGEELFRTPLVFVGVNAYAMDRLRLRRKDGLDGGRLFLGIAKHGRALPFLRFALRTAWKGLTKEDDFERAELEAFEVDAGASRLPVALDGELHRLHPPLRYRVRRRALTVLMPPGEDSPAV